MQTNTTFTYSVFHHVRLVIDNIWSVLLWDRFQGPYDTVSDTSVKLFIYAGVAVRHMLCLHMTSTYVALVKGGHIM